MWRICKLVGFPDDKRDVVSFWAEQIVALYFAAAEAVLDKRQEDRGKLVEALALSSFAIMRANLRAAGLTGQVVQEVARRPKENAPAKAKEAAPPAKAPRDGR
jgi:hypothetical protein